MCRPTNSQNRGKLSEVLYLPHDFVLDRSATGAIPDDTDRLRQEHQPWLDATTLPRIPTTADENNTVTDINITNTTDIVDSHQERLNRVVSRARTVVQTLNYRQRFLLFVKILTAFIEKHYRQSNNNSNSKTGANDNNDANAVTTTPPPPILVAVRSVLVDCISRYRSGDENYLPLEEAISMRLLGIAGIQLYWNLTRDYLGYDLDEQQR